MAFFGSGRLGVAIVAALIASGVANAQNPESRIDTTPRLELRPPVDDSRPPLGDSWPVDRAVDGVPGDDRHAQLELEQKERREALRSKDERSADYLALGVIVVGTGLTLLLVVVWGSRRKAR